MKMLKKMGKKREKNEEKCQQNRCVHLKCAENFVKIIDATDWLNESNEVVIVYWLIAFRWILKRRASQLLYNCKLMD